MPWLWLSKTCKPLEDVLIYILIYEIRNSIILFWYTAVINDLGDKKVMYFLNGYRCKHETTWKQWKLMKFIKRCSVCVPLVNLQTSKRYSKFSHILDNSWLVYIRCGLWNFLLKWLALECDIPGLSHISVGRNHVE
jgi:hypothetical protein